MQRPEPGIYLAHKPRGVTSFSIVREAHEALQASPGRSLAAMHGGTLDPFAEGLLLLLVGQATKLFELLHAAPKTYVATIRWGVETDTGNPMGTVVAEGDSGRLTPEVLDAALTPFLGWTEQIPPATSAKKIGGEPAYRKVLRGEEVSLPPSRVYLHSAQFLDHDLPDRSTLEIVSRGGYYVRALARDLGRATGARAHLTALHRTTIGPWRDPGPTGARARIAGADVLPWADRRVLSDQELGALRKGAAIERGAVSAGPFAFPRGFPDANAPVLGLHRDRVVALLRPREDGLALERELAGGV